MICEYCGGTIFDGTSFVTIKGDFTAQFVPELKRYGHVECAAIRWVNEVAGEMVRPEQFADLITDGYTLQARRRHDAARAKARAERRKAVAS